MKILLDGMNLSLPKGTGIATYARNFALQASMLGHSVDLLIGGSSAVACSGETDVATLLQRAAPPRGRRPLGGLRRLVGAAKTVTCPTLSSLPVCDASPNFPIAHAWHATEVFQNAVAGWRRFSRMTGLTAPGIDLAFWTAPVPIFLTNARNIYTIHDMVPARHPEMVDGAARRFLGLCSAIAKRADHIVTVSEHSRQDLIDLLKLRPSQVSNTYQTLEAEFWDKAAPAADTALPADLIPGRYFLFFGAIEPKKNIRRIIEAHDHASINLPLVIVGSPGWNSDREQAMIAAYRQRDARCRYFDHLPRAQLIHLIRNARATVFPALYEGFGLPVLESMALGTPVLGSTTGSLPEIISEAGLLADARDISAIRAAMALLADDETLHTDLKSRGLERSKAFTPAAYRARLEKVLHI